MAPFNAAWFKHFRLRLESDARRTTLNRMNPRRHRLGLLVLMLPVSAFAIAQSLRFDIPAQPLPTALKAFADQAKIQLLYRHEAVKGATGNAVVGDFDTRDALQMLLKGTGLEVVYSRDNAATIRPMQTASKPIASVPRMNEYTRMAQAESASSQSLLPAASAANSEDSSPQRIELEEILVTGSHIRSTDVPIAPVTVIDRTTIERSGIATTEDLVRIIPQNFGGGATSTNFSTPSPEAALNLSGGTGVDLLGLGAGATLTLLNGMRLAPSGFGSFVDVSSIPITALERVEVVTDGASAMYGSDAVAGVVNFILRKDYEGAETRVRYGAVTDGDSDEARITQSLGKVWSRGNAFLSYEYYDTSRLSATDRSFASEAPQPLDLVPETKRHSALLSGGATLTDALELHGVALYSHRNQQRSFTQPGTLVISNRDAAADAYAGNLELIARFLQDWRAAFAIGFSRSDETIDQSIIPADGPPSHGRTRSDLGTLEARADGPIFDIPGGPLSAAFGVSARRDEYSGTTTAGQGLLVDLDRHTEAAFLEIRAPFVSSRNALTGIRRLELSAAVRYEDYSDFGGSTNPKVSFLWSPLGDLNVRAGWGRSFNAPRLEYASPYNKGGIVVDFVAFGLGPFPPPFEDRALVLQDFGVDPNLGPERAKSWNIGIEWAGSKAFSAHANYFSLKYRDRIGQPATTALPLLEDPVSYAEFIELNPDPATVASLIQTFYTYGDFTGGFDPSTTQLDAILNTRTTNLASTRTSGIEFGADFTPGALDGKLHLGITGLRFLKFENSARPTAPSVDILNTIYNPVDLRLRGQATWSSGLIDATVAVNYTGSYTDDQQTPSRPVASWTTFDANVILDFDQIRPESGLSLALSAINLFDRDPPDVMTNAFNAFGFDPTNANALGRFLAVELRKTW